MSLSPLATKPPRRSVPQSLYIGIGECMIENWQSAGLLKSSAIKSAISTIEQGSVLKILGRLSSKDLSSLEKAIKELLGLGKEVNKIALIKIKFGPVFQIVRGHRWSKY